MRADNCPNNDQDDCLVKRHTARSSTLAGLLVGGGTPSARAIYRHLPGRITSGTKGGVARPQSTPRRPVRPVTSGLPPLRQHFWPRKILLNRRSLTGSLPESFCGETTVTASDHCPAGHNRTFVANTVCQQNTVQLQPPTLAPRVRCVRPGDCLRGGHDHCHAPGPLSAYMSTLWVQRPIARRSLIFFPRVWPLPDPLESNSTGQPLDGHHCRKTCTCDRLAHSCPRYQATTLCSRRLDVALT
jgi:hypothetical protein